MPRGHVTIDGKPYILQDESYSTKPVPMFRPQLQIEGISHEALDQYLYMVQGTWDKGTNERPDRDGWSGGTWRTMDGLDSSEAGKLKLQRATESVKTIAGNAKSLLIAVGGFLYAFVSDGDVFRTSNGTTWATVTYDDATFGAVTAVDLYVVTSKSFVDDYAQGTLKFFAGTATGKIWHATVGAVLTPTQVADKGTEITLAKAYRGHVAIGFQNTFEMWPFTPGAVGGFNPQPKYTSGVPGTPVAAAVWNGVLMVLMQVNQLGSVISVADLTQISDTYEIHGEFIGQSMATWGSELVYAGFRPSTQGEIYTFQENLSDIIPRSGAVPYNISALAPSAHYILAAHNAEAGLWWVDKDGGGPLCGADDPGDEANRVIDSIAYFLGQPYFALRNSGIMRMSNLLYRTEGTMDTGWFTGGFPELTKEWSEVVVRLDEALALSQTVVISGRIDDDDTFLEIGSLVAGDTFRVLTVPTLLQRSKRFEIRCEMTGSNVSTPTVTAIVARYLPRPVPMRVWGFTIKAFKGISLLDGSMEHRTPEQIIDDLYELLLAGQVSFSSVLEPEVTTVYVTNVQIQAQLLGKTQTDSVRAQEEAHIGIELLEALTSDFGTGEEGEGDEDEVFDPDILYADNDDIDNWAKSTNGVSRTLVAEAALTHAWLNERDGSTVLVLTGATTIKRSTDGGASFTTLAALPSSHSNSCIELDDGTILVGLSNAGSGVQIARAVAPYSSWSVVTVASDRLLAQARPYEATLWQCNDDSVLMHDDAGGGIGDFSRVYRSTDRGLTWAIVLTPGDGVNGALQYFHTLGSGMAFFVAGDGSSNSLVYRSTAEGASGSWSLVLSTGQIAFDGNFKVRTLVALLPNGQLGCITKSSFWRSSDNGANWVESSGSSPGSSSFGLWAGEEAIWAARDTSGMKLFRSLDNAVSWTQVAGIKTGATIASAIYAVRAPV